MVAETCERQFKSLRVSLTGECNLACTYCVPAKRCFSETGQELTGKEIVHLISLLNDILKIEKIRLTGGEPLISPKLDQVLPEIYKLNISDISLTTNAQLLKEKMEFLVQSGINRLNISLDTLEADRYHQITRGGILQKTLDGIDAALRRGIKLKINMVPVLMMNEDEIVGLLDFCLDRKIELRYIELMQMGHLADRATFEKKFMPIKRVFTKIKEKYTFTPAYATSDSTSSRYYINNKGYFGVIANDSAPFCKNCNRLRLSANGSIRGCLSSNENFPIAHLTNLPKEKAQKELETILTAALKTKQDLSFNGSSQLMKQIGG